MKRRDSLKALAIGSLSAATLLESCKTGSETPEVKSGAGANMVKYDRFEEQIKYDETLVSKKFFSKEEMAVITILVDIIIPKDEISGSATDAGVPAFIDFIVQDKPEFQLPLKGGLKWLDIQMVKKFGKGFAQCSESERMQMIDAIAWPNKAIPEMKQGANFFTLMRNLTASGFYSTEMGWKDIGYVGNKPNEWKGVPAEVLEQYGLSYTEKDLKECI